ncbi:MAG: 23S rRNA (pseudouridine(1915)-N(3))-methyltransferase RlmH [Candidatus Cloacimonetes bacterium]|nr:23S rRNA (pseudouridine(1915)-N(3))-methyltransferase RlmH [Candidatus Cloacimonadota bacterium]
MSVKIIAVGKTKQNFVAEAENEYLKRLSAYCTLSVEIVPDVKLTGSNNIEIVKGKEAELLEKRINPQDFIVILDERGEQFTSPVFSQILEKKLTAGNICFIIGGVYGLADSVKKKANLMLGFSKFTFTHQIIRILLLEQLYRAYTIMKGKKYHY